MLVLSRKPGQKVVIGDDVTLTVVEIQGSRVTLGIQAPDHVHVLRAELQDLGDQPTIIWSPTQQEPTPDGPPPL